MLLGIEIEFGFMLLTSIIEIFISMFIYYLEGIILFMIIFMIIFSWVKIY